MPHTVSCDRDRGTGAGGSGGALGRSTWVDVATALHAPHGEAHAVVGAGGAEVLKMEEDKDSSRGFRVTDRRRFSDEGEARPAGETVEAQPEADAAAAPPEPHDLRDEPVSFSTFVLGLSTQALLHLGEIASPGSGAVERDLGAAKHVIDILGILKEKTRSNLEQSEEQLLDAVLYDLRIRYVELVRGPSKEEA